MLNVFFGPRTMVTSFANNNDAFLFCFCLGI
eukprot:SAG11_NODE_555_length_8566_cov_15.547774_8_plen_31_part_00